MRRQHEESTDRLTRRLAEIAGQGGIAAVPPEVCGAAVIVPARAVIEAKAMSAVEARERSLGFVPRDVSAQNYGYDIESPDPETGRLRFIEVTRPLSMRIGVVHAFMA